MGDLDINLIQEFSKCPAFYDRSDMHFKDKVYLQKCWAEISSQLGYDVPLLKDRIYQLRNRYNLEKRRLENIRAENPDQNISSPWSLFNHLKFLDNHIKPRRSYKTMMMKRGDNPNLFDSGSNLEDPTSSSMVVVNTANLNGLKIMAEHKYMQTRERTTTQLQSTSSSTYESNNLEIKSENESEDDNETEEEKTNTCNGGSFLDPINYLADGANDEIDDISIIPVPQTNAIRNRPTEGLINVRSMSQILPPKRQARQATISYRSEKYEAFGKFLSASLCDLTEDKALSLVEKFTTEVVRALIDNHNNQVNSFSKENS